MLKYILKRIIISIFLLLGVSVILYVLLRCMPTDFVENRILALVQNGGEVSEEFIQQMYHTYGLDGNIFVGYFTWLGNVFQGDFGNSFISQRPVLSEIFSADRIGTSFFVAFIAVIFEFMIAIPLGITAATHQYSVRDYVVTVLVLIGISLPSFFFGQMLKDIFANKLGWFPVSGMTSAGSSLTGFAKIGDYVWHMVLPILTVVILSIGSRMRMTRTNMLEVLNSDYIRTARAKGLNERKVIYKHAFRNTMIPLVTSLAGLIPSLFSGAMITEQVFSLTGIGSYALNAMQQGDIPVIMTYNMFLACLSVLGVLLADLMYAVVDPRVKLA
ncbi:MAG TPA: ABC transporter permease [Candidatus Borkfalkia avicola]|uniref:ABC transporter permease n=1 Tax=Candidatus Borkfalkia avicola TaxID=2838503 RepID=A0A9D2D7T4_9FIRM|nr:ABC transporter permease [Candidatus Borkfalkia avicola]